MKPTIRIGPVPFHEDKLRTTATAIGARTNPRNSTKEGRRNSFVHNGVTGALTLRYGASAIGLPGVILADRPPTGRAQRPTRSRVRRDVFQRPSRWSRVRLSGQHLVQLGNELLRCNRKGEELADVSKHWRYYRTRQVLVPVGLKVRGITPDLVQLV